MSISTDLSTDFFVPSATELLSFAPLGEDERTPSTDAAMCDTSTDYAGEVADGASVATAGPVGAGTVSEASASETADADPPTSATDSPAHTPIMANESDVQPPSATATAINAQEGGDGQLGDDRCDSDSRLLAAADGYVKYLNEHVKWADESRAAESRLCNMAIELSLAKERVKVLRESLDEMTEQLMSLRRDEPKWNSAAADAVQESLTAVGAHAITNDPASPDSNAWRSIPIAKLDLKPATEAKLLEGGVSTIGQVEDLRSVGSGPGIGLQSIKGIGEAKADAIEEAVIVWLTKNRDRGVFQGSRQTESIAGIERPEPADGELTTHCLSQPLAPEGVTAPAFSANGDGAAHLSTTTSTGIATLDPNAARAAEINIRARELLTAQRAADETGEGAEQLEPTLEDDRYWNGGVEGFDRGLGVFDCPIDPAGPERDDWIRGWLTARLDEEEREGEKTNKVAAERAATQAAGV